MQAFLLILDLFFALFFSLHLLRPFSITLSALFSKPYLGLKVGEIPEPIETPNMGLLHPEYPNYFTSPQTYLTWYLEQFKIQNLNNKSGVVAILIYRWK